MTLADEIAAEAKKKAPPMGDKPDAALIIAEPESDADDYSGDEVAVADDVMAALSDGDAGAFAKSLKAFIQICQGK